MSQYNFIALNNTSFDKFSKKLYQELKKQPELSLAETREITSKSLGFRNYNGVKDYLQQPLMTSNERIDKVRSFSVIKTTSTNDASFLKRFSNENIISMVSILIKSDDMWSERALILLKMVLSLLDILSLEKNTDNIREYILFDRLFSLYNTTPNLQAKELLLTYFKNMLPGFSENGHNSTASDQNSYLSVQIIPVLEFLKSVEKENFLMFSLDWILFSHNNTSLSLSSLKEFSSSQPGHLKSVKNWEEFFHRAGKFPDNTMHFLQSLSISEAYQDSWLCDEAFISMITSKIITLKYEHFYFSDFLYTISNIIHSEKKKTYISLLQNIKHNYESCIRYSEEIVEIVKR